MISSLYTATMIENLLKQLEFNDKEITVYLALLQQGKITPTDLAHMTGINRTTVYSVAKELIKKGVVSEDLGGEQLHLVASPPEDLEHLIKREEKKLAKKKEAVSEALDMLKSLAKNTKYTIPKIVFIGEDDLENYLHKQTPVWNKSIEASKESWWGFQDKSFVQYYEKWIDWYWENTSKKMEVKLLSNESAEEIKTKKYTNRQIKFWKDGNDFTATVWVSGNYVVMIVTSQHPHYLVEIHDTVLAHNMRQVFKGIWKTV